MSSSHSSFPGGCRPIAMAEERLVFLLVTGSSVFIYVICLIKLPRDTAVIGLFRQG